jgi:RNA polymerase sigma-70 factor (ECF subfamily)
LGENTDHQLMTAVRDGDLDKLGYLFEKYHKQLYNFFLRQARDVQLCEDMVQEVFLKMLKYRHTYRGKGKFTTWMYSIAHNAMVDQFRKAENRYQFSDEIERIISTQPTPEEISERSNRYEILYKALDRLSDEKREVLVMSRFHNLKYEEISKVLGCPVGTIKARVFHAMNDLRTYFNQQRDEASS